MTAPIVMTPGVYFTETDLSQYIINLSSTMLAIVTVAPKGAVNQKMLITSAQQLTRVFGIPTEDYPGLLVAREFLNAGGTRCWIVRVTDQTDAAATVSVPEIDGSHNLNLTASSTGTDGNKLTAAVSYGSQLATQFSGSKTLTNSVLATCTIPNQPIVPGTVVLKFNGVKLGSDDSNGNIVLTGALAGGTSTVNYKTGVVNVTPPSGFTPATHTLLVTASYFSTFNLQVKYTVTLPTGSRTYVVESFTKLDITNLVARLANSQYLTTTNVGNLNAFPTANEYALSGGTDGASSIQDSDYIGNTIGAPTGLQIFAFPDQVDINLACVPGISTSAVRQALIELVSVQRQDAMCIIDPPVDATITSVVDWANAEGDFSAYGVVDSTYATILFPWYSAANSITNELDNMPPSAAAVQAFARSQYWQAPAGPNRGVLQNVSDTLTHLTLGDRSFLGDNRINPIGNLHGLGIMVLGQKTSTLEASSLDRNGARMTLLTIEKAVTTALYPLLFEPNTQSTWDRAINIVQPYLNSLVKNERIYFGQIICDKTTNTNDIINNNEMYAVVKLILPKYAEIIVVNFELDALGATITENVLSNTVI